MSSLKKNFFIKNKIVFLIIVRMGSKRLKNKAKLKINNFADCSKEKIIVNPNLLSLEYKFDDSGSLKKINLSKNFASSNTKTCPI